MDTNCCHVLQLLRESLSFAEASEQDALTEVKTIAAAYWRESSCILWRPGEYFSSNQLVAHDALPGIGAR